MTKRNFDDDLRIYENEDEFIEQWKNHPELSQQLANFIPRSTLFSPLELSITRDWFKVVELFIKKGASIDEMDFSKRTPLTYALLWEHYKMAQFLLDLGADFTINNYIALFENVFDYKYESVKLLIDNKCSVNVHNDKNESVIAFALFKLEMLKDTTAPQIQMIKIIKLLIAERIKMVASIFHTLPQYIILWITDWLEGSEYLLEYQKVQIIEGMLKSIDRIKLKL